MIYNIFMVKGSVKTNIHKIIGEICYIYTQKRNGEISGEVLIDKEDAEKVLKKRWSINSRGYVTNCVNKKTIRLHTFIGGKKSLDHINRNTLDNRKCNLREITFSNNQHNKGMFRNNTSGIKGVTFVKRENRWHGYIRIRGKQYIKNCKTKEEAINFRKECEKLL